MFSPFKTTYNYFISSLGFTDCLHTATQSGNIDKVRELLNDGIAIDALYGEESKQKTALHIAVEMGFKNIVELLLEKGANPNCRTREEKTALHLAAEKGFTDIGTLLLENGADPDKGAWGRTTPMYSAIKAKSVDFVHLLLIKKNDLAKTYCYQEKTPLDIAVEEGSMEIVKLLEGFGVEVSQAQIDKANAMNWCQLQGHDVSKYINDGNTEDGYGQKLDMDYALWDFVRNGNATVVRGLLQFEYYKNLLNTKCFDLYPNENIKTNFPDLYTKVEGKVTHGRRDFFYYDADRKTNKAPILIQAVLNIDVEMTRILVRSGADTDVAVNDLTLNQIASQLGNSEIINILKHSNVDEDNITSTSFKK